MRGLSRERALDGYLAHELAAMLPIALYNTPVLAYNLYCPAGHLSLAHPIPASLANNATNEPQMGQTAFCGAPTT